MSCHRTVFQFHPSRSIPLKPPGSMFANGLKATGSKVITVIKTYTLSILHKCVDFEAVPPAEDDDSNHG